MSARSLLGMTPQERQAAVEDAKRRHPAYQARKDVQTAQRVAERRERHLWVVCGTLGSDQ